MVVLSISYWDMAFIRDFEMPNTGAIISNAYHVISEVQVQKRIIPFTNGGGSWDFDPLRGNTGYVGIIFIQVFASKQAREEQKKPLFYIPDADPNSPCKLRFVFDATSTDSSLVQAYNYLKTISYYNTAIED
jgi:hypothetical protein